ncbi:MULTISPECIES: hypothetical protein [unclassified Mesorhizobium]|uniref:hypothetical protein n=1 Tax=unclassified Mesorhizobium TaxID=325217 RepID=UPI000FDBBB98|nr:MULTISPECIES: hypothetical protein [unclassified Mesorhizobium]TGR39955.1 hypothetical protein EN842_38905 [bacterium M00.F.Ca.ET.199.01.1.1]TGU24160.1 hypothetical protein EN799_48195 [bacterium M00.F.Ca.ET.156.01.1.1]TGV89374.1 hypothetical protein EN792_004165 [Mesorhizobium sp. M00.F.Ca.ET.149.01.1.1]TGR23332.1 hypothetical protein EN845_20225 [Mesorhizobium sp. M8A.F.Ca.ET.202.01.1.1]TGR24565.1 hypothetical protein EN840_18870 [Mesorhizobium sp. M8A.F.Ca.ET.197.01.1.1]
MIRHLLLLLRKTFSVGPKAARTESKGLSSGAIPAIHDSSPDDLSRLELDAEVSAEEYFIQVQGETAVGFFEPTNNVSFAYEETEWDVADLLSDTQLPAPQAIGPASSLSTLRISVDRLRMEAETRRWLSPKSRSALEKLGRRDANLARSELNALDYLLARATGTSRLATDIERIQDHITNWLDGIR